jgi:hypothetical protein
MVLGIACLSGETVILEYVLPIVRPGIASVDGSKHPGGNRVEPSAMAASFVQTPVVTKRLPGVNPSWFGAAFPATGTAQIAAGTASAATVAAIARRRR